MKKKKELPFRLQIKGRKLLESPNTSLDFFSKGKKYNSLKTALMLFFFEAT